MSRRVSYRLPRRRYSERRKRMVWVWLRPILMREGIDADSREVRRGNIDETPA